MIFGKGESIKCIQAVKPFSLGKPFDSSESLCYAARITTDAFLIPYRVRLDSYVLGIREGKKPNRPNQYYEITQAETARLQQLGYLPDTLPSYEMKSTDYFAFWIMGAAIPTVFNRCNQKTTTKSLAKTMLINQIYSQC